MPELAESRKDSFLKRPIASWLRLDGYALLVALILVAAVVTRLWDLGSRAYNHDEAIHAWESWKLYTGQGYTHNPVYHGPFLYHATALGYFLFGHNDFTGRLAAAAFGIATVALIFCFRRWLGNRGTLLAAALAVISPSLLYYGRFIRHDAFSLVFTLMMALGILNYLERRQNRYLYLTVLGQALYFANMETAFIQTFTFWTFLVGLFLYQWRSERRPWRGSPAFDLLIVMGTLLLPLASPVGIKLAGAVLKDQAFDPLKYQTLDSLIRSGVIWAIFFAASAVVGLLWDRRRWAVSAGLFYTIFIVLFTSFFTNGYGLATGQVGQLGYWLSQQGVRRGGQPWHYYLVLLPLYDYLPLLFGGLGALYYFFRRRPALTETVAQAPVLATEAESAAPATAAPRALMSSVTQTGGNAGEAAAAARAPEAPQARSALPFVSLLVYWFIMNLVVFSWGGEKMPWLSVHMSLPLVLLAGWFGGRLLEADWRALWRRRGGWVALLLPLFVVALAGTLSSRPFRGTSSEALEATMSWLGGFALLLIVGLPLVNYVWELGWRSTARIALCVLMVFLAAMTVHNAVTAVYINGDSATEMMTYAQASYDVPMVMRELETMSRRLAGGEKELKVAYDDDDSSWPFVWYFRDWPNARFYGKSPNAPFEEAVVIVGPENEGGVKPFLGNNYYRRQYRLVWWPDEGYKSFSLGKVWETIRNPELRKLWLTSLVNPAGRERLWDIVMYRDYHHSLTSWPLVHNFAMYVRKDVAAQLWDYGPEVADEVRTAGEDLYTTQYRTLSAQRAVDIATGALAGQPKEVAVDAAGQLYVTDGSNHQVQVYGADGALLAKWGSEGNGQLQFQEPWGVAVGPDGSIYVADTWNHRIQKLDAQGSFVASWGLFGDTGGVAEAASTVFYGPRGVAVDPSGNVWVTDTGNKRVVKFSADGQLLGQYGGAGNGDGQFQEPVGIAVDTQGNVYVADTWNQRVQVFDNDFNYLRQWPIEGWWGQSVQNKPFLAVDQAGSVYVTDPDAHRVIKFDGQGKVLAVWGYRGSDMSAFDGPFGVAVGGQGQVFVADTGNHRVLEFAPLP